MERDVWRAVALLVGAQIGAGVLGLPYAIKDLGFFWGGFTIVLAGVVMMATALFLVEALYSTNPHFHLFDLVEEHFGRLGAVLFLLFLLVSIYGALSAYLDGMGQSINHLTGIDATQASVVLWLLLSAVVVLGLRTTANTEAGAVILLLILFALTVLWAVPYVKPYFHVLTENKLKAFASAFSVAVFAFFVHLTVPEAVRLVKKKKPTVEAVYNAFIITIAVYVLFSLSVIGVLGNKTPQISVFGLVDVFGPYFAIIAYLIPLVTMLTSFVAVGLGAVDMLTEALRLRWLALILVLLPPLIIFLLGLDFFHSILLGSIGLLLAGGIVPSLLVIKMKRGGIIPHRTAVAYASLILFLSVLLWTLISLV